jgi:hypothetical protein
VREPRQVVLEPAGTIALTLLTLVTAIGLCRLFPDWAYLRQMVVVLIGVHAAAAVMRFARLPVWVALPLVVLVTGGSTSPAAASVRAGLSPDETMIVVSIQQADGLGRLSVDGTTLDALVESWSALVVGSSAGGLGTRVIA